MKHLLSLLSALAATLSAAEPPDTFTPPQAYPVERYEAGWSRNPFTLKTAPVVVENASFAKDLVIGGYYGDAENPTIVVVNTKTHERTSLRKGKNAENGMTLGEVKLGDSRKDISASVTFGSETSELRYDNSYMKQVAAAETAKTPQQQHLLQLQQQQQQQMSRQPPGAPQVRPIPGQPQPPRISVPLPNASPATTGVRNAAGAPPILQAIAPAAVPAQTQNLAVNAGNLNLTVSSGSTPIPTPQLVSQVNDTTASPVPARRRFIPETNPAPQ